MKFSGRIQNRLLLFGFYQIIGGIIGLVLITWLMFNLISPDLVLLAIIIPACLLFLFSMYCGYLLIKGHANGIKYSLINQYLQLISFAIGGYAYQYFSGVYLTLGFDLTGSFTFIFGLGVSSWRLNINTGDPTLQLNFNFIALVVIVMLDKLKGQIRDEQNMNFLEEPGLSN